MSRPNEQNLELTLDELLAANTEHEVDVMLQLAAEDCGYWRQLPVSWEYWHFGRHAEQAEALGLHRLARLFSAAWRIVHEVHGADNHDAADDARREIRAIYADSTGSNHESHAAQHQPIAS